MVSIAAFTQLALSFPGATEQPHFQKSSFRVNKKIFATLDILNEKATLKLSLPNQDLFCLYDKEVMYPVPNKWGKQGWTFVNLNKVPPEMLTDALTAAYQDVAPTGMKQL